MAGPLQLFITNLRPQDWRARITDARQVIGRSGEASIRIPDQFEFVSRRHAEVWHDRHGCWLQDLGSKGGTHINGVWIVARHEHRIRAGDRISLAGLELYAVRREDKHVLEDSSEVRIGPADTARIKRQRRTAEIPPELLFLNLSRTERDVVMWLSRGYSNLEDIGRMQHRSPNTVRTHLNSIFKKLEVHSREELLGFVRRMNAIDDSQTELSPRA